MSRIKTCYDKSIENLEKNSTDFGLMAAGVKSEEGAQKSYTSLFSRDIGVSSLGMIASGNKTLIDIVKRSLESLAKAQSKLGQFPFYYKPEQDVVEWWMPGSIDSTLWWCVAFLEYYKKTKDEDFYNAHKEKLENAYTWLLYQDTNNDHLVEQGEASDWADEMPRLGTVLYSNALWYWLVRLRVEVEKRDDLEEKRQKIYEAANTLLWIHKGSDHNLTYLQDKEYVKENTFAPGLLEGINTQTVYMPYYLGFVSHKTFEARCDVYANILACISGLADDEKAHSITDHIIRSGSNLPYPVKVMYPPIYPGEADWRTYMMKGRQNYPWQYHNAGIWPYVGGFWVYWLFISGHKKAEEELDNLAKANELNDWEFNEYLHGQHGTPMGIAHQSWNMGAYLLAFHHEK